MAAADSLGLAERKPAEVVGKREPEYLVAVEIVGEVDRHKDRTYAEINSSSRFISPYCSANLPSLRVSLNLNSFFVVLVLVMDDPIATDVSDSAQVGASPDAASSSDATSTAAPAGASPEGVNQPSDQITAPEPNPLEGVPTLEELQGKEGIPYAKALAQLRGAYEPLSIQHKELSAKYQPYEPVLERFQTADELQSVVKLTDSLNKYSADPESGALRPDLSEFVAQVSTDDPVRADHLASTLIWGQTTHPGTGQPVTRAELVLQVMANDPELRAHALRTLGGVEPSAVPAPTWTPSEEELNKITADPERPTAEERALQEVYKKLSYEERDELKLASPEFVKSTLRTIQQNQLLQANEGRRVEAERQYAVDQERRVEQEAVTAGDSYVEQGFKTGFTNFANHIYETWKPTDNAEVNKREGALVALAVAALSTPDTRFAAEQAFKEMGIDQKTLDEFNATREGYAKSGREFGYLAHKKQRTNGDPSRAQQKMIAKAKDLATVLIAGRNEYFKVRATTHNNNLDQTERARPLIGGSPMTSGVSGSGNRYLQAGKRTEAEIYGS